MLRIYIYNVHLVVHIVYICAKHIVCLCLVHIVYLSQKHCVFVSCAHRVFVAKHFVHFLQCTLYIYIHVYAHHPCIPYHSEESLPIVRKKDRPRADGTLRCV